MAQNYGKTSDSWKIGSILCKLNFQLKGQSINSKLIIVSRQCCVDLGLHLKKSPTMEYLKENI